MSDNLSSEQIEILRFLRSQEGCTVSRERFFEAFPSVKLKTYTALGKLGYILLKTEADPISLTDSGKGLIEAYLKQETELQYQHCFNDKTLKASDESNTIAREANEYAKEANIIAREANEHAKKANATAEKANVIADNANEHAKEANTIARDSNKLSEKAIRCSKISNWISGFALLASFIAILVSIFVR